MFKLPTVPGVVLKAAPYVVLAILAGLLYLANGKIESLKSTVTARGAQITTLTTQRDFFKDAVTQRDVLISRQNASIQALADAAQADRSAYLDGIAAAKQVSADHLKASSELLALKAPDGELAQCRAARDLLEQELVK